jgi:hypothetical protein
MLTEQLLAAMMDVSDRRGGGNKMDLDNGQSSEWREESSRMESEMVVSGAIIDSWVESTQARTDRTRLVLQVAPRERPKDLVIVEAEASLVPDRFWLEDLSENLCHGSPVLAVGRQCFNGFFAATRLQLAR